MRIIEHFDPSRLTDAIKSYLDPSVWDRLEETGEPEVEQVLNFTCKLRNSVHFDIAML